MKIRIVKNAKNIGRIMLSNNTVLRIEKQDTDIEGVSLCRYFMYNIEKNKEEEILKEYNKYDLFDIIDVRNSSEDIYFLNIDDITVQTPKFRLYKYNILSKECKVICSAENGIEQYLSYARLKLFVLNDDFLLMQNEYLRANLTEDFEGYFDFELQLYSVLENKTYKVLDENLNNNGVSEIIVLEDNIYAIKTGFSLLEEERYNKLSKEEVSVESVIVVNIAQLVSDMMIMKQTIVMDAIDQTYYDATIPYIEKDGEYLIYSKVNFEKREEEITFYNFKKKEVIKCINKNIYSKNDLGNHYIINGQPCILHNTSKGTEIYNIEKNKITASFGNDVIIEEICNDFIIVSEQKKGLFGKKKNFILVYKYPIMNVVHKEMGIYKGCLAGKDDEIFILLEDDKGKK